MLTSAEDFSESSLADTHTPKSKNDNQGIDVKDQRLVAKQIKMENNKWFTGFSVVVDFNDLATSIWLWLFQSLVFPTLKFNNDDVLVNLYLIMFEFCFFL